MENKKFNLFTQKIISRLPYWMKIRKADDTSLGAKFLNVFGVELKEIYEILNYAYEQVYVETIDVNQINVLYKAFLENYTDVENIQEVTCDDGVLNRTYDINYLVKNEDSYYLDSKRKIIYCSKSHSSNPKDKYGYIYIKYNNIINRVDLELHHVWNFLDEFGFLLDCRRLSNESNFDYKNRLMDVFVSKPSSSMDGLLNAVSRELGIRIYKEWIDGAEDFIINDKMIVFNKIKVDGKDFPIEDIKINLNNQIVLKGNEEFRGVKRKVTYASGIEMHQLHNRKDKKLMDELFDEEGFATDLLKEYARKLKDIVPIEWGCFVFDESFYDLNELDISGEGFIPSFYDASIKGFTKYK